MRHFKKGKQLGKVARQRKALLRSLAANLVEHGRIKTTLPKAKVLRPYIEKLVSQARKQELGVIRELRKDFRPAQVKKLTEEWAKIFADRKGGYTRIIKLSQRFSDAAEMAIIEFVEKLPEVVQEKPKAKAKAKVKAAAKAKAEEKPEAAKQPEPAQEEKKEQEPKE